MLKTSKRIGMICVRFTPLDRLPSLRLRSPIYPQEGIAISKNVKRGDDDFLSGWIAKRKDASEGRGIANF